jgi:hypothetical protein
MMEFDGGLSRDEAERAAYALVNGDGRPHSEPTCRGRSENSSKARS